jgi:hypothetical protein
MKHPDEDILLKNHLYLLDEDDRRALASHLDSCASCQERSRTVGREIEMIGSVDPELLVPEIELPARERERWPVGIRVAAILLIGFFVGYGYSRFFAPSEYQVVPSYHSPSVPSQTIEEFSICESVNLEVE